MRMWIRWNCPHLHSWWTWQPWTSSSARDALEIKKERHTHVWINGWTRPCVLSERFWAVGWNPLSEVLIVLHTMRFACGCFSSHKITAMLATSGMRCLLFTHWKSKVNVRGLTSRSSADHRELTSRHFHDLIDTLTQLVFGTFSGAYFPKLLWR